MDTHTGLSQPIRQSISEGLAHLLADTYALYIKTQNFHWNVTAHEFFSYHLLFEKQYEELAEEIDELAERIRALGFFVEAGLKSFAEKSRIPESDKLLTAKDMLEGLMKDHEHIVREARKLCDEADKQLDVATVDLLGRRIGGHEKMAWMLRSHL